MNESPSISRGMNNGLAELQYNALGVVAYHKEGGAVCKLLSDDLFDGNARIVFIRLKEYWQTENKPPENANLEYLTKDLLEGPAPELFESIIRKIHAARKVNPTIVLRDIADFARAKKYKQAAEEVIVQFESRGVDAVDDAAKIFNDARDMESVSFDKGVVINQSTIDWALEDSREEIIRTGIPALDKRGICPCKKELYLVMAPPKGGKSWSLCHFGALALTQGLKVLHVTLEMSDRIVMRNRYLSALFGIPLTKVSGVLTALRKDDFGRFAGLEDVPFSRTETIEDKSVIDDIKKKVGKAHSKYQNLIIKGFPSGSLTVDKFEGYLSALAHIEGIRPDMIIVDYADLFQLPADENRRHALDSLFVNLRRIADERNCAVVTASQVNRMGAASKKIGSVHAAESFSKVMTADIVVSLNTTPIEKKRGLTRLSVVASRNSVDGFDVLIANNLAIGQFCVESCEMSHKYEEALKKGD